MQMWIPQCMMTAQVTESHIAFCSLYKLGHRVTWAVLPWSVALLAWLGPHTRIMHIKVSNQTWAHNANGLSFGLSYVPFSTLMSLLAF